jgi:hypothetical protein
MRKALVPYLPHPIGSNWTGAWAAFAAADDPVDALKVKLPNWAYEGLKGKKSD